MPSGAKKRKAAKKKKEQLSNNSSSLDNTSPRGNDDPKSQDERESDGGEVGSPASQEHHSEQHPFNEENEEFEKKDLSSFASGCKPVEDAEGSQKVGVEYDTVVITDRELNPEQYMVSKDIRVEHVESAKESPEGDDKSSSSSSSDEESRVFDVKWKEEALNLASSKVEKVFTVPTVGLVTPVVPLSELEKHVMEGAEVENSEVVDVVEPGLKENEDKLLLESSDAVSSFAPDKNKDNFFPMLDEKVGASKNVVSSIVNGNEDKALTSSGAHGAETVNDSGTLNGIVVRNEAKTLKSLRNYTCETSNDADKAKDTEGSGYTETQPLVPPDSQASQRTSWISCCGLFDVFTGSNR